MKELTSTETLESRNVESSRSNEAIGKSLSYDISSQNIPELSSNIYENKVSLQQNVIPVYRETPSGYPIFTMYGQKSPPSVSYRRSTSHNNTNSNDITYSLPEVSVNDENNYFRPIVPSRRFQFPKLNEDQNEDRNEDQNESKENSNYPFTHTVIHDDKGVHRSYFIPSYNFEMNSEIPKKINNQFSNDELWKSDAREELMKFSSNNNFQAIDNNLNVKPPKLISLTNIQATPNLIMNRHFSKPNSYLATSSPILMRFSTHPYKDYNQNNGLNNYYNSLINKKPKNITPQTLFRPNPWFTAVQQLSKDNWIHNLKNYHKEPNAQSSNNNVNSLHFIRHNNRIIRNQNHPKTRFGKYEKMKHQNNIRNELYPFLPDKRFFKVGATLQF
jgi:hypothetical protein